MAVVNIGGVSNVTWLGANSQHPKNAAQQFAALTAFDTGPGGAQLDDWVRRYTQQLPTEHPHAGLNFDQDGCFSKEGNALEWFVETVLDRPFYAQPAPKSLDRQDAFVALPDGTSLEDGAHTLAAITAATIAAARHHFPEPVEAYFVCGGGRHNPTLMRLLRERCDAPVFDLAVLASGVAGTPGLTDAISEQDMSAQGDCLQALLNGDMVEARLMAYLAVRSVRGLPLSWPTTTGCHTPSSGGVLCLPAQ